MFHEDPTTLSLVGPREDARFGSLAGTDPPVKFSRVRGPPAN